MNNVALLRTIFKKQGPISFKENDFENNIGEDENGFYKECFFKRLLVLERKRSERSRNHFLLMLLDISKVATRSHKSFQKKIAIIFELATRGIDVRGWYKDGKVVGIIFFGPPKGGEHMLVNKMKSTFANMLEPEESSAVEFSWIVFPNGEHNQNQDKENTPIDLYRTPDQESVSRKVSLIAKRSVDIAGSLFFIALFSPLFVLIPLAIKLTSEGPVFFRQLREGKKRKTFSFLKFRSMYANNDAAIHKEFVTDFIKGKNSMTPDGRKPVFKIKNDPRVTFVGRFLRKTSLDEIPQFFNVLKGEMSLVGPRPPIPYEVEHYDVWHLRRVLEVKPGITGLWQVEGRSTLSFDNMVRLDLYYIKNWSFLLDLKLLIKTPFALVKGAY